MSQHIDPSSLPAEGSGTAPAAGPDFYGQLGLTPFETNVDVISAKVRDLMREARKYQLGPNAAQTQTRLDDLAAAAACLLDPNGKRSYDDELRRRYGLPPIAVVSTYVQPGPPVTESHLTESSRWTSKTFVPLAVALTVAAVVALVAYSRPIPSRFVVPVAQDESKTSTSVAPIRETPLAGANRPSTVDSPAPPARRSESPALEETAVLPREAAAPALAARPSLREIELSAPERDSDKSRRVEFAPAPFAAFPERPLAPAKPKGATEVPGGSPKPVGGQPTAAKTAAPAAPQPALQLTSAEVLRELKDLRLKRTPASRIAADPRMLSADRVLDLVQYARSKFGDDRKFQRQLEQEVVALKRAYPQLREILSSAP